MLEHPINQRGGDMITAASNDLTQRRLQLLFLAYLLMYPLPWLEHRPTTGAVATSAVGVAAFLILYFRGYWTLGWTRLAYGLGILGIGFSLYRCGGVWSVFAVYAASMAGFSRPGRTAAIGVMLVLALVAGFGIATGLSPWEWGPGVFFGAIVGIAGIFIGAINERNSLLAASREESRQLAVLAERERIARDLHDVLGHTLTLVAVKADLARRLLDADPGAARREIDEIHASARAALGEVRVAVSGMRSTTLAAELSAARHALETAGITVDSETTSEPLPPLVETTLAFVIREAATNVIRHSGARRCRITLARVGLEASLEIRDDGHGGGVVEGHGLAGMRQRLAVIRGALELRGDSGMSLLARVPLEGSAA
jgi:two-component system sensor histidine kinase DesK